MRMIDCRTGDERGVDLAELAQGDVFYDEGGGVNDCWWFCCYWLCSWHWVYFFLGACWLKTRRTGLLSRARPMF